MSRFAAVPNEVFYALEHGEITSTMFLILCILHKQADWSTGIVRFTCARTLVDKLCEGRSIRTVEEAMANLQKAGYLKSGHIPGSKRNYPVTLNNYTALTGTLKDTVLNPCEIRDWRSGEVIDSTTHRADASIDDRTDASSDAHVATATHQSQQESEQSHSKSETISIAKAVAVERSFNPLTEEEADTLEFVHFCVNEKRDVSLRENTLKLIYSTEIPNPVTFAHQMMWAYRKSNYRPSLNGFESFLRLYPKIAKSYKKYYDQEEYRETKTTPEERLSTLPQIRKFVGKILQEQDEL